MQMQASSLAGMRGDFTREREEKRTADSYVARDNAAPGQEGKGGGAKAGEKTAVFSRPSGRGVGTRGEAC